MSIRTIAVVALTACAISACSPHRMNVRQGNFITQSLIDQVEVGMTREQVQFLLGRPLASGPFNPDRWDYIYYLTSQYVDDDRGYLVVWFDGDVVERLEVRDRPRRDR